MRSVNFSILSILFSLMIAGSPATQAQTLRVIHNFSGRQDGANPTATLTFDARENLYGTTFSGGIIPGRDCSGVGGCGIAFKMTHRNSKWTLNPLYTFTGFNDGAGPVTSVIFGPGGVLYGTADGGGSGDCTSGWYLGCGVVFKLQPSATTCHTAICSASEVPVYQFTQQSDGLYPDGTVVFDQAGNLYGTTYAGGLPSNYPCGNGYRGCGIVYKLAPSGSGWVKSAIYSFMGGTDGGAPYSGLIFDQTGNLYGTTEFGGANNFGTVFQLTPSGSGWTENVIYSFLNSQDGAGPLGGLVMDGSGNLYGTTFSGGIGGGGTVFELSPSNGGWTFTVISSLVGGQNSGGPRASLTLDRAGNLYGTTSQDGAFQCGNVFKLMPSNGHWTYTDLYDFTCGNDGGYVFGGVALDGNGNLFGTTLYYGASGDNYCGSDYAPTGCGVVWEITP
jgi:uncharacterized repeat protein (TIGR03803 family)